MSDLEQLDTSLFLWINRHHCEATDWVLWVASQGWSWIVVILLAFSLTTLRREPRRWWLVLVGIGLCFLLADRISVLCFKDVFCRLRPCQTIEGVRMFRTSCGGLYGFVSSHAANVFAVAMFLTLRYWKRVKRQWPLLLIALWAIATCYSRPYLGKHYPGDVICGAVFGAIIALIVWWVTAVIEKKFCKSETK